MRMKTVLTQEELADRWGVSIKTIREYRLDGIIQPIKGIPAIRFSLEYIQEIEGVKIEKFSPLERKRMENEIQKLTEDNKKLKEILGNILSESSKIINLGA